MAFNKENINSAKEILGEKAAYIIAKDLNIEQWDEKGLKGCCPFKTEKTPSFIWNKKENYFKCFSCAKVYGILDHFQQHYGYTFLDSVKTLFLEAGLDINDININCKGKDNVEFFKDYKYPKEECNKTRDKVEEYLLKRSITKSTLDFAGIKQDFNGNIVFEHRDMNGTLLAVKYRPARAINKNAGEGMMWWQNGASNCPVLYGIEHADVTKPLVICEGHIDCLSIIEAGYTNAVSIPHGANDLKWIEFNYSFLEMFDDIILWFDNDSVGQKAVKDAIPRIGEHKIKVVKPDKDIENKIFEYWKSLGNFTISKTDANNVLSACGKDDVLRLIKNAEDIEIPDVIKLMDCSDFDITEADIVSTGFASLDKKIYGYIGGTVNIFTGYSGEGKTTTMMQTCVLPALEEDRSIWIFSGELQNSLVKNWVTFPMAGKNHITEWDNGANKPKGYKITNEAKEHIEDFYRNKIFFYDNYLNTKPKTVIDKMIYTYKKYGTKIFIIDNLMCIDFGNETEQYSQQKDFMMNLIATTARYGFFTHLCCHPRKPGMNKTPDIYSIFGTSAITNLVHRMFWIMREYEEDVPYDGKIWIGKDRMTGISNAIMQYYYNKPTRRIYTDDTELNKKYKWEEGFVCNYNNFIKEKLICNKKDETHEIYG